MEVGIAVRKGSPEIGAVAGEKILFSDFSFGGVKSSLDKRIREKGWIHRKELDGEAGKLLQRAVNGEDVFDWSKFTPVRKRVSKAVMKVGTTAAYGEIAERCGTSPRAVGTIMHRNPFSPFVPCHRIVAKNGIGGFAGGVENKKRLLKLEASRRTRTSRTGRPRVQA